MKKLIPMLFCLSIFLVSPSWALPTYTGSLIDGDTGELIASGAWYSADTRLDWIVNYNDMSMKWSYQYTFHVDDSPGISHVIVQVSDQHVGIDSTATTPGYSLEYFAGGPSNPGWLSGTGFWGIKWEGVTGGDTWSWTLITDRGPMWGDFYAKGGSDTYAYNSLFTIPPPDRYAVSDGNNGGYALVPDTVVVPEPLSLILLGSGLIGCSLFTKRKFLSGKPRHGPGPNSSRI